MMAKTTTLLLLLFLLPLLLLELADVATTSLSSPPTCTNRRIHIRSLPRRYNTLLLRSCSSYHPLTTDLCPHIPNSGLGPKVHNRSGSWHLTHHHLIERFFHRRVLEYPCLVQDPSLADAVFLPYYAGLDSLRFLYGNGGNSSVQHGLDLFNYLVKNRAEIWRRSGGSDHFLVSGRSSWDFSRPPKKRLDWGTSFLEMPEFYNITVLTPESRRWSWQEQAIPYLTSFHPATITDFDNWVNRTRRMDRRTLMLFVGSTDCSSDYNMDLRRKIVKECRSQPELCKFVDCSQQKCEKEPIEYIYPMLHSKFCLHPPGNTPTRRGVFDGIIAGCIPVFFDEMTARLQYKWHMQYAVEEKFSVFIAKDDVVLGKVKVEDVLARFAEEEVEVMRARVLQLAFRVMYRRHRASAGLGEMKDAFDLAIDGVLRRIKSRGDLDR